jgi:selenium metabolism protein YedF
MSNNSRHASSGTVVIINSDQMGKGDSVLGAKLLLNFLFALTTLETKPDTVVFYNAGVKLLASESFAIDALKQLDEAGTDLLACVTCLEFFELTRKIGIGQISNMREIVQRTMNAAKVITI